MKDVQKRVVHLMRCLTLVIKMNILYQKGHKKFGRKKFSNFSLLSLKNVRKYFQLISKQN